MALHIDHGSWLDCPDCRWHLVSAVQKGDKDMIDFFLDAMDGDVGLQDDRGAMMLSHAAENGQVELTRHLLAQVADYSIPDAKGKTAVYWTAVKGNLDALKILIEAGAAIAEMDIKISVQRERVAVQAYLEEQLKARAGPPAEMEA